MNRLKLHCFDAMDHGFRVRWLLAELGRPYESVKHDFEYIKSDAFYELNPFKRVPVIEDEGVVVYESGAICWWLAEKYGSDLLLESDEELYPSMLQWTFFATTNFDSAAMSFVIANRQQAPEAVINKNRVALADFLSPLNNHFSSHHWVLGKKFTLPDILLVYPIGIISGYEGLRAYPSLQRYLRAFMSRPVARFFGDIKQIWKY